MVYLHTNTPNQIVRFSLNESRQYFTTAFTDYLIILIHEENSTTGTDLSQVATIQNENQRITTLIITTVPLELSGRYRYEIYGQNSNVNLDPLNTSIVGLCRIGWLDLKDSTQFYDIPNIIINDDIIYNG